jgi:hypothetical protein
MTSVEFPYCKFNQDFSACNCDEACLLVTLKQNGKEVTVDALIDSGCTITHVHAALAYELGIDLATCTETETVGISGAEPAWLSEVTLSLPGLGDDFRGPVLFTQNLPVPILLGQKNFFEKFDVHFQKSKHLFTLKRVA